MTAKPPSSRPWPIIVFIAVTVIGLAGLFGLASRQKPAPPTGRGVVAATIFPLYDIVRHVAGDGIEVRLILPPGAEPHSFEPTPSLIRELSGAKAVYAIGHGLDDWADAVAETVKTPKVIVDKDILIRPQIEPLSDGPAGGEGGDDPHYWLSAPNAIVIARNVANDLAARFPGQAPAIRNNLAVYQAELAAADAEIRRLLAGLGNRRIITFHEAWYYFAEEYGLTVAGSFEPTAGREPTPRYLAALKTTAADNGVRVLYTEPLFSADLIRSFAADNGLKLAAIDDIGGTLGRDTLIKLLLDDARTIKDNQ